MISIKPRLMSSRFLLFLGLLYAGIYTLIGFVFSGYLKSLFLEQERSDLILYSRMLSRPVMEQLQNEKDFSRLPSWLVETTRLSGIRLTIIRPDGSPLADSHIPAGQLNRLQFLLERPEMKQARATGEGFAVRRGSLSNDEMIFYVRHLQLPTGDTVFLRLGISADIISQQIKPIMRFFYLSGLMVALLILLSYHLWSRHLFRILQLVTFKLKMMHAGEYAIPITINEAPVWQELGDLLNQLAARMENTVHLLAREKEELHTILSSISEGILAINETKRIIYYNNIALSLLEPTLEEIRSRPYYDVIRNAHLLSLIDQFFARPYVIRDEIELGEDKIAEVIITPLESQRPGAGCVVVIKDITHFKKLEKIRRDFVANVSHEFKTPLAAIRGYTESLLDWALDEPEINRKYLTKILRQSRQLENLVSDLLELARIERLQGIELKSFNPFSILDEIILHFKDAAEQKGLSMETKFPSRNVQILGDPEMFRSIMVNLIDNAVKYTPAGGSILVFTVLNGNRLKISVKDTGIGIPRKDLDRIFERFYRVDRARSREAGGTGLGLSIVKHLAELQQAQVSVESEEGKGSCFSVEFQLAETS